MTQTIKHLGIIRDMPEQQYHAVDACSNSRLSRLRNTPAHCRHAIDNPQESDSMLLGSLTDCLVFTPNAFDSLFIIASVESKAAKAWKEAEAEAAATGKTVCKSSQVEIANLMRESIMANGQARKLIEAAQDTQLSIFWNDEDVDGLYCKARIDLPLWMIGCNFDMKTTRDASNDGFEKSIWSYGYFMQAAMYEDAASVQGHGVDRFGFILVENEAPYLSRVVELSRRAIDRGHHALDQLKPIYHQCNQSGVWPGYPEEITVLDLPAWTAGRI